MDVYEAIRRRRDVRAEFVAGGVPEQQLRRILAAAHAAPSVGLTQPWDFVVVRDPGLRARFQRHVQEERAAFAGTLDGEQARRFRAIRIDGIRDAALGVVVTCDPDRGAPAVLGARTIPDTALYSTCLAIQNLWLAATAEGLGVGWVSFYREEILRDLLRMPDRVRPVAWLCLGPTSPLAAVPDLERHGWRSRMPLAAVIHVDAFTDHTG